MSRMIVKGYSVLAVLALVLLVSAILAGAVGVWTDQLSLIGLGLICAVCGTGFGLLSTMDDQ